MSKYSGKVSGSNNNVQKDPALNQEKMFEDLPFYLKFMVPSPSTGVSKKGAKKPPKFYFQLDSDSDTDDKIRIDKKKSKSSTGTPNGQSLSSEAMYPSSGYFASKKKKYGGDSMTNLRSLYSNFPIHYTRTIFMHLFLTIVAFFLVFPVINCFWSYTSPAVDHEMEGLLHYATHEEVHDTSFWQHLQGMKWLSLPTFPAEVVSLFLSFLISDMVCLRWLQELENLSLTQMMERQMTKKYY